MGSTSSKPSEGAVSASSEAAPSKPIGEGGCPVKHSNAPPQAPDSSGCPVKHSQTPSSSSSCPVKHSSSSSPQQQQQYNVYSQPIDPKNQMPAVANQLPSPQQTESLSTERVKSTIPKVRREQPVCLMEILT